MHVNRLLDALMQILGFVAQSIQHHFRFFLLSTGQPPDQRETPNNRGVSTLTVSSAMNILYVEDNPDVRELICLMLEEEGLAAVACANAEDAEVEFSRRRYDMLITDVSLPGTPGTELARRLQKTRPDLWVVFCTGYPMQDGLSAWGARARCLGKPFESEELHALLDECRAGSG